MKKDVIVVSGPPGAGSTSVARSLAERLGFRLFVPGKLQKELVDAKNESEAALLSWKTKIGSSAKTHENRDNLQIEEAKKGNIVLCGKLSIHFLKELSNRKIWLDVPLEKRAERAADRDGTCKEEAMKKISEREDIERKEWQRIYGFDYFYQKDIADFVLDSSDMSLEETVDKIIEFIDSLK